MPMMSSSATSASLGGMIPFARRTSFHCVSSFGSYHRRNLQAKFRIILPCRDPTTNKQETKLCRKLQTYPHLLPLWNILLPTWHIVTSGLAPHCNQHMGHSCFKTFKAILFVPSFLMRKHTTICWSSLSDVYAKGSKRSWPRRGVNVNFFRPWTL